MAKVEELTVKYAADSVDKILVGAFAGRFARVLSSHWLATRVRLKAFDREIVATVPTADLQQAAD